MKKLLLMLAGAVTAFAASANIVEDFSSADWLPTADANGAEQFTSTSTGIVYTMSHCKKGVYSGSTYLQVSGKSYQNEAYISFALPEGCKAITFKTGTNASTNVTVTVTVGETTLGNADTKLDTKDADFTFSVPEGVTGDCKVLVTNKYNAQFQSITYVTDGEVTPPVVTPGEPVTSLNADFTGVSAISQLEGWTSNVVLGDKPWYFSTYQSNTYAACTGYKGTSTDGYESWLITPALNVKDAASKTLSFETQCAYLGQDALKVYALSSDDVATATRHELDATIATAPASGYSEWVNSGELSLEGYGDVVYVGFCYTSPVAEKYTTYCIDNVKFNSEGGEVTPPVVTPGESYTVAEVIALGADAKVADATVIGYIVGFVPGQKYADATFSAEGASNTNLLLADSKTETDAAKCIPVQLPSGDVRNALNLAENPGNLGAKATLTGSIEKYFGVPGLKSVTKYELEGVSPVTPDYPTLDCIGDWLDEAPAANTSISGTVTVVYQNNLDLFVQDETGTVLVYGTLPQTYESGDQLTGITGKYKAYNMLPQFTPVSATFGEPVGKTAAVKPAKISLADVDVQNLEHYVTVSGLEIVSETTTSDDKTTTTYYATDGTNKVEIYNRYRLETLADAADVTITGFVWIYGNDDTPTKIELVPTEISDNSALTEISADAAAGQVYDLLGRRVAAPVRGLYIRGGRKVLVK